MKKKKEKKKKDKKLGKAVTEAPEEAIATAETERIEEDSVEASEEDSLVKQVANNRAARVGMPPGMARKSLFKDLNEELSTMSAEAYKTWGEGIVKALKAKSAKCDDGPVLRGKIHSRYQHRS